MLAAAGLIWLISLSVFLVGLVLLFVPVRRAAGKKAVLTSAGIWVLSMGMCVAAPVVDGGGTPLRGVADPVVSPAFSAQMRRTLEVVSASTLVDAYKNNELAADNKYKGRRLTIQGTVDTIGKDILDNPYITLGGDGSFRSVQCFLDRGSVSRAMQLSNGDSVTVEGRDDGLMMNVLVKACELQ